VASVYDADETEDGRSYFVMELIDGERLDEFVERHRVSRRERLRIFVELCHAIQHAHTKSVIHLDLKPSNVLVQARDSSKAEDWQIKVVDFGVGAITGSETTLTTRMGVTGGMLGTLSYMSPEQRRGQIDAIDVRSDVYSLGVILFKLMTGELPYPVEGVSFPEAWRVFALGRQRAPQEIDPSLPPDVVTIIRKAIAEEPLRRYQSVAELGGDVQRYLNDLPITARPPSTLYEWTKFAKRNKGAVATFLAILLGMAGTIIGTAWGMVRAQRAEVDARETAEKLNLLANYVTGITSDEERRPTILDRRQALEVKRAEAEESLRAGDLNEAEKQYARVVWLAETIFPEHNWYVARIRAEYAACLMQLHRYEDAEWQLLASYDDFKESRGEKDQLTREAAGRVIRLYDLWGKPNLATGWRNVLKKAMEPESGVAGPEAAESQPAAVGAAAETRADAEQR
jgi:hypothetical protein